MTYLQNKKLTFMSIVNRIKGFVRSVSGTPPLILSDCVDENSAISYSISGNSIQNGTPTPDNPVKIESVGDKTKNLLNLPYTTDNRLVSSKSLYYQFSFDVEIGKTYTLSCKANIKGATGSNLTIGLGYDTTYGTSNLWGYTGAGTYYKYTFTPTKSKVYFYGGVTSTAEYWDFQLEEGSTATEYEPYGYKIPVVCSDANGSPITTNIYLDAPLRKATSWGYNYQDYIDFEKQKVIRRIGKYSLSSLSWVTENQAYAHIYKNTSCNFYGFRFQISDMLKTTRIGGYCNMFRVDADNNVSTKPYGMWIGVSGDRTCYFCLPEIYNAGSTDYERVLAFNEWMKGRKPIEIYYILETARETSVAIPELPTVKGTTVYTVDTSVQPTNMSVTYYATSKE